MTFKTAAAMFSISVIGQMLTASAFAACGEYPIRAIPMVEELPRFGMAGLNHPISRAADGGPGIVGMWKVTFTSRGNTSHVPSIPDGAVIDFGYSQWHIDGTEFLNSGGRSPASQNYCLGVWKKTGGDTYALNHFALAYDPGTGSLMATVNIREEVKVDQSGDSYTGTFTIDVFSLSSVPIDHVVGVITAQRVTVD